MPNTERMKAWQFTTAAGGLEKNLYLPASGVPKTSFTDSQILVEVYSMAINPADHKVPELGLLTKAMVPSPCTPGMDFCGRVAAMGAKVEGFKIGDMVFGSRVGKIGGGTLGQFVAVDKNMVVALPDGVAVDDAASAGVTGLTAIQALKPYVKKGNKVFVNGGSGGTGVWTIQVAKALGCHVTTSCSSGNIEFCKSLGADEVLDYKAKNIVEQLKEKGVIFDHIVDNVGHPSNLFGASASFLVPHGNFVQVGVSFKYSALGTLARNSLLPGFLGGVKRGYHMIVAKPDAGDLTQLAEWMKAGTVKAVIDEVFPFDSAPKAFEKLKVGHAKGKIVVKVK